MTDEGEVSSAEQDAWIELARAVREQITRQVPFMSAMKPDEMKKFLEAVKEARWLEECALVFDATIEKSKRPFEFN